MASIAAFSLVAGHYAVWLALWVASAVGGTMTSPIVWIAAINGVFDKGRSMATAVVLSGTGITMFIGPSAARYLVDSFGWQQAFQLLALIWGGISLAMTVLFFHDNRPIGARAKASETAPPQRSALGALLLSGKFIRLALAVFAVILVFSAVVINLAPVLVEAGLTRAGAAGVAGLAGLASIAGKLSAGTLFDRVRPVVMTTGAMLAMGIACLLTIAVNGNTALAVAACIFMGLASGATVTIMVCLIGRIFRAEDFGTIYGALMSVMGLSSIVGPVLAGVIFDAYRSYAPLLWAGVAVAAGAAVLLGSLAPGRTAADSNT